MLSLLQEFAISVDILISISLKIGLFLILLHYRQRVVCGLETYRVKWICIRFIFYLFTLSPESGLGTYPGKVDVH